MDLRYHADMCEIRKCTKFEQKFIGMFIINSYKSDLKQN